MTSKKLIPAVAYYRTSSASNVGVDKDSEKRQREAVEGYARKNGYEIVQEYYDAAVSGSDPIDERAGFSEMLNYMMGNGARVILVESPTRFARDLTVQMTGHSLLKDRDITLIPVDYPDFFTNETDTAVLVRQILGAISQFEKAALVGKLKQARERKREETGRCEGRPAVPPEVVALAKKKYRRNPKTGKKPSYRAVAKALFEAGYTSPSGKEYGPESIKRMLQ